VSYPGQLQIQGGTASEDRRLGVSAELDIGLEAAYPLSG
jgi:hypothetical protein